MIGSCSANGGDVVGCSRFGQYETAIYVAQLMIWRVLKASTVNGWQGKPIKT
jgi:hypothetical protein